MAVMTSQDWERKQNKEDTAPQECSYSPDKERVIMKKINVLQFSSAPMGVSNVAAYVGRDEVGDPISVQFELIDKQLHIDNLVDSEGEPLSTATKLYLMDELMKQGFTEVSYYEDSGEIIKEVPIINKTWKLGHPDNTPENKIAGNFGITVVNQHGQTEELVLELKDGAVTTDRPEVASVLYAFGFYDVGIGAEVDDLTKDSTPIQKEIMPDESFASSDDEDQMQLPFPTQT